MDNKPPSTFSGLYQRSLPERQSIVKNWAGLDQHDLQALQDGGLSLSEADLMIENVIGRFSLPLGIAANFLINQRNYLIPMVIEEPSVVAACSYAAKLFRSGGGFTASSDDPMMIGQIQLLDISDTECAVRQIRSRKNEILAKANEIAGSILQRGGGAVDIEIRELKDTAAGDMLILHLLYDTRDAMGANAVNSALEHTAPLIETIAGGRANLKILSNLSDRRRARAEGMIPRERLTTETASGQEVVDAIIEAAAWADSDPYRAATHNKGIMNGIDALLIATGNDWRAVEAGAHAYAARSGRYTSLTAWRKDESGNLHGRIEAPMALGIVGGATRAHRLAQTSLKLLGLESARQLAEIAAAVGLAQNLAAIRALATDGIQRGHMRMHARQLALAAGADSESALHIARQMIDEDNIRLERAREIMRNAKKRT